MPLDQLTSDRLMRIEERLDEGSKRMDGIDSKLNALADTQTKQQKAIDGIQHDTAEIREILGAAKGFFKVAAAIGTVIKWVAGLAAAVAGLWVLFTQGGPR